MAVEVKRELDQMIEVDRHLKRMQLIRQYPPELIGNKQLFGAMAGGVVDPDVKDYAYELDFFVLEIWGNLFILYLRLRVLNKKNGNPHCLCKADSSKHFELK
jgi:hypothetical protein